MNEDKLNTASEKDRAEAVAQAMKLIIEFNGSQLREIRRLVDTLLDIRQQKGSKD